VSEGECPKDHRAFLFDSAKAHDVEQKTLLSLTFGSIYRRHQTF
jgi:hypothetical protein